MYSLLRRLVPVFCSLIVFTAGLAVFAPASGLDFGQLEQGLGTRFGPEAVGRLREWERMLQDSHPTGENERLRRVNDFFNRHIVFDDDISVWGQSDYWATPMEFIGQGAGDCEDFSIAKYFSLIELGVSITKLRLVYVKVLQQGPIGPIVQAHMVVAYYARPNADPLILDNLNPQILPASSRHDLTPIFSFNSQGLWQGTGNQSSRSNLSRWQDLLQRTSMEGFH